MTQTGVSNPSRYLLVLLFSSCWLFSFGQKDALKQANEMYNQDRYHEALIYLNRVKDVENSAPLLFKRAICHFHTNKLDNAHADIEKAIQYGYKKDEIDYYLATMHHHKGRFESAAIHYKKYLNKIDQKSPRYHEVVTKISQCGYALNLAYQKPIAIIENVGNPINTLYDEINWIKSPNAHDKYYYTTNRPNSVTNMSVGHQEIYQVTRDSASQTWQKPQRLNYPLNTGGEELMVGISQDGEGLLLHRQDKKGNRQYLEHRRGMRKKRQRIVDLPMTTTQDNEVYFYADGLVIFAADLPSGYGGLDLYATVYQDGAWSKPVNLGSQINSPYDEKSPYLVNEGDILYFSSNRSQSVGGYDIYQSTYMYESRDWGQPHNLGLPINSPGDELHFRLNDDGLSGHFSSNRKNSTGGYDIYRIQFFEKMAGQDAYIGQMPMLGPPDGDGIVEIEIEEPDTEIDEIQPLEEITAVNHSYTITPVYYHEDAPILSKDNRERMQPLVELLTTDKMAKVELISHTYDAGIMEYSLYTSFLSAQHVRNHLINNGVKADRIYIKGLGDNYPIIKNDTEGGNHAEAIKYNNRIDFKIHNASAHTEISYDDGMEDVDSRLLKLDYELFRAIVDQSVTYKIQIATVQQMYRGVALSLFNDAAIEPDVATGLYAYTIGLYQSYAKALQTKRHLENEGMVDVRIIPYYDGLRLSEDEIIKHIVDFPDLKSFIKYDTEIGSN